MKSHDCNIIEFSNPKFIRGKNEITKRMFENFKLIAKFQFIFTIKNLNLINLYNYNLSYLKTLHVRLYNQ